MELKIATRGSRLALWQAHFVQDRLKQHEIASELVLIETQGDRQQDVAFSQMQGQGFFTKAVQDAVLDGRADLAVHSLKDLPSARCPGLSLAAIPQRVDARDALLIDPQKWDPDAALLPLPEGAKVGTSAARRRAQLRHLRPDLQVELLRGNVPTRIHKLQEGQYDAIVLAAAGFTRLQLDLSAVHVELLAPSRFVPAPGQGALAIECREADDAIVEALSLLHDPLAASQIAIERGLMARLDGGCQLALGAYCQASQDQGFQLLAWYEGQLHQLSGQQPEALIDAAYLALTPP